MKLEAAPPTVTKVDDATRAKRRSAVQKTLRRAAERGELSNPLHGHYGPSRR